MASSQEEPMDIDSSGKDGVQITLSLKWSQSDQPQKLKTNLEKSLQSWFNKRNKKMDCSVINTETDRTALIKVSPTPDMSDLQNLSGQTLSTKDGKEVKILAVVLAPLNLDSQGTDDESKNPPSSMTQTDRNGSDPVSKDGDPQGKTPLEESKKSSAEGLVSLSAYWYVNHIYKEEIKRIEKENKVEMKANVSLQFEADQDDGSPKAALDQFTKLVQDSLTESRSSVHPLKFVDPDQWSDAMRVFQEHQNKLFLTLSSEQITVFGPSQSQEAFSAAINAMPKRDASPEVFNSAPRGTSLKIDMTIKDPIVNAGLTLEQSHWKQMTAAYINELAKIKRKFGVDIRESSFGQDTVIVNAASKEHGGNASLESHAMRALLQLYQKTATSLPRPSQWFDATGLRDADKFSNDHRSREGLPAGDDKDDTCSICLCTFTNKRQLKCKHEFCNACLQNAEIHSGPICPICKDVFGTMTGDQPDGTMLWSTYPTPLPGFKDSGHIMITYDIPSGLQKENHPNPGQHFSGTCRIAYLPDNQEGKEVVQLLKKAFDQKLTFTVGASRTTGAENQVTWNDIHHKTSVYGGPERYGYPDPDYLKRVKEELKAKGIK